MDWIESDHKHLRPKSIHDPDILDQFGDDYMYFACIRFINSVRLASFLLLLQRLASCTAPSPDLPALHLLSLLLPTPPSLPVSKIKTASLRWHSPMLDDISAVKTWSKVNSGMLKMFTAEVLGRLPVMQHFLFGSLLPPPDDLESMDDGQVVNHGDHVHAKEKTVGDVKGEMFGDCCGIPVPVSLQAHLFDGV
jgi:serine/threonine-protein phosphatase 2A activator